MARRKINKENIRKLVRLGKTSLSVTLPIKIIKELKWKEKQKVVIKKVRGGMIIKDWKK